MSPRVTAAALLLALAASNMACAEAPPVTSIDVSLKVPSAANAAGVHVWLSGGGSVSGLNEDGKTDTDGHVTLYTRRSGFSFVVARRKDCDIAIGGAQANLPIAGPLQYFRRGRLDLTGLGTAAHPDYFFSTPPGDGEMSQPGPLALHPKTPGKARFLFCAEDSEVLRRSLAPDHVPMQVGKIWVTGDWNDFNLKTADQDPEHGASEMFDDGNLVMGSGDDRMGDGVYTRTLDLPPGDHAYAFFTNTIDHTDKLQLDPYAESSRPADPHGVAIPVSVITVTADAAAPAPVSGHQGPGSAHHPPPQAPHPPVAGHTGPTHPH